ncbi:hypothetical protein QWA68_002762 [Fusarium oxysporum]|nr:hypothetical protein QWA68_002762 [Fusarium oxysporum]WKT47996.1 hypothetical protein QSH57_012901 [Fusarium oxysporum f. sp. vasinfectum]
MDYYPWPKPADSPHFAASIFWVGILQAFPTSYREQAESMSLLSIDSLI